MKLSDALLRLILSKSIECNREILSGDESCHVSSFINNS